MAVREAFLLFISSQWVSSHILAIDVVKWVKTPAETPWRIKNIVAHIENLKEQVLDWSISREANDVADNWLNLV
ncbi:hypothetical protein PTKIN_Ptkin14bG0077300 [Pterospermum kingtungense]